MKAKQYPQGVMVLQCEDSHRWARPDICCTTGVSWKKPVLGVCITKPHCFLVHTFSSVCRHLRSLHNQITFDSLFKYQTLSTLVPGDTSSHKKTKDRIM